MQTHLCAFHTRICQGEIWSLRSSSNRGRWSAHGRCRQEHNCDYCGNVGSRATVHTFPFPKSPQSLFLDSFSLPRLSQSFSVSFSSKPVPTVSLLYAMSDGSALANRFQRQFLCKLSVWAPRNWLAHVAHLQLALSMCPAEALLFFESTLLMFAQLVAQE